jgi:hypothetical protein
MRRLSSERGLEFNPGKCEWLGVDCPLPSRLAALGVRGADRCIKVLGAYIGDSDRVRDLLLTKLAKHSCFFERLESLRPSPQAMALLTKCCVPRQGYIVRVQQPEDCADVCARFDDNVRAVVATWFGVDSGDDLVRDLLALPVKMGGLGVTPSGTIRYAAYAASYDRAIRDLGVHPAVGPVAPTQGVATLALHESSLEGLKGDPTLKRHLEQTSERFASRWLTYARGRCNPDAFAAAVRYRLRARDVRTPYEQVCDGCSKKFEGCHFVEHCAGCPRLPEANASTKSEMLVKFLERFCNERAGVVAVRQPKGYQTYTCGKCRVVVDAKDVREHGTRCKTRPWRSGPDLAVHWKDGCVIYDLTIVHGTAASYSGRSVASVVDKRVKEKKALYDAMMPTGTRFVVLPVLGLGGLHANTLQLLSRLADAADAEFDDLVAEFGLVLQEGTGRALCGVQGRHDRAAWLA